MSFFLGGSAAFGIRHRAAALLQPGSSPRARQQILRPTTPASCFCMMPLWCYYCYWWWRPRHHHQGDEQNKSDCSGGNLAKYYYVPASQTPQEHDATRINKKSTIHGVMISQNEDAPPPHHALFGFIRAAGAMAPETSTGKRTCNVAGAARSGQ